MSQDFDHTTFEQHLHVIFSVQTAAGPVDVELDEVEVHPQGVVPGSTRQPFTLIFLGPKDGLLPEGLHKLSHDDLGEFDLYLIPILSAGERQAYQSIFN
jgi:hypothetical protein